MANSFNLTDKVVVVTGGCGFLGRHFTAALKTAGATVVTTDITAAADQPMDVANQASIDAAFNHIIQQYKAIDTVINNAAIDPKFDQSAPQNQRQFVNYPEEAMRRSLDINLMGTWRVCKTAVKQMRQQGHGNIVNIASLYGVDPPRQEIYPTGTEKPVDYPITKAAVIMLTRHIASQFGQQGIRCNALAPGGVFKDHDKEFQQKYSANTSLNRMNTPAEVADALVFLCSDASRGMTGETLVVDAGWTSR